MSLLYALNKISLQKFLSLFFLYSVQCVSVFTANNYHGGENLEEQLSEKELADLKAKELDILVKFDRMCKENNLRYFITAGTLLGAVRHKGFIPVSYTHLDVYKRQISKTTVPYTDTATAIL